MSWLSSRLLPSSRPRLSVVVPVYAVERYLDSCLQSILQQPLQDLEVVVVDDGSTDGSAEIARRWAAQESRVRYKRQENAGLGAARSAGIALCRGEYFAFVDSDDVLPPDAYSASVRSLEETGSDFAIGTLVRDDGTRLWTTKRMRDNHAVERRAVTVETMPEILSDVFAVNKVYRRSFWATAGLAFPAGVRYEDQPTLTEAMLKARAIDVLPETVYVWRARDDGSSITQGRHELTDLRDRIVTKRWSAEAVTAHSSPEVQRVWFASVLPVDMWEYFRAVPNCSHEYWTMLRDAVRRFWHRGTVPFEECAVPPRQRLMGWLVAQDRRADLEWLLRHLEDNSGQLPVAEVNGVRVLLHPFTEEAGLPQSLRSADWQPRDGLPGSKVMLPARAAPTATELASSRPFQPDLVS